MKYIQSFHQLYESSEFEINQELVTASEDGELDEVQELINKGADVNAIDSDGTSALIYATYEEHYDIAEYLIKNGANVNVTDNKGRTPLILASSDGNAEDFVRFLLANGADINQSDDNNRTALMMAAVRGRNHMIEVLLEYKPDVLAKDIEGKDALRLASTHGFTDAARVLKNALDI